MPSPCTGSMILFKYIWGNLYRNNIQIRTNQLTTASYLKSTVPGWINISHDVTNQTIHFLDQFGCIYMFHCQPHLQDRQNATCATTYHKRIFKALCHLSMKTGCVSVHKTTVAETGDQPASQFSTFNMFTVATHTFK